MSEVSPQNHRRLCVQSVEVRYPLPSGPGAYVRATIYRNPDGYFHCRMCSVTYANSAAFFVSSFLLLLFLAANWPPAPHTTLFQVPPHWRSALYFHAGAVSSAKFSTNFSYPTTFIAYATNFPALVPNPSFPLPSAGKPPTVIPC